MSAGKKAADAVRQLDPIETFMALSSADRPHKIIDFPRKGEDGQPVGKVALLVLTAGEMALAQTRAAKHVKADLGDTDIGRDVAYINRVSVEILMLSLRKPEDITQKFACFSTVDKILDSITSDELDVLFMAYNMMRAELGPIITELSQVEVDAWLELLAEGASAVPLAAMSWATQQELLMLFAKRLWSLRTGKSSPG